MTDQKKRVSAVFFATPAGGQPVRDWLKSDDLTAADRTEIGSDIRRVEVEWPQIGKPTVGAMGAGLWEVRSSLPSKRIARLLFGVEHGLMVIVHGFIKKTQQTPDADLKMARKRWAAWKKANP